MHGALISATLLASAASVLAATSVLRIHTDVAVECERKTRDGDMIQVHYRGKLASNGEQFDASYDRGQPFEFTLGQGMVIKG